MKKSKGNRKGDNKERGPLSEIGGEYGERYSLSFVQASIVPNYFPTLRIFEYNITGLDTHRATELQLATSSSKPPRQIALTAAQESQSFIEEFAATSHHDNDPTEQKKKKRHKFKVPTGPSKSTPPGPAYSPQTLSLLGYTQYFANLSFINNDFQGKSSNPGQEPGKVVEKGKWKPGHHKGKVKDGKPNPKKFKFEVEYDTFQDKAFGLKDLTVRSYLDLAKRIALSMDVVDTEDAEDVPVHAEKKRDKKKKKKHGKKHGKKTIAWYAFIKRAFVGTMDPEDIEDAFVVQRPPPQTSPVDTPEGPMEL